MSSPMGEFICFTQGLIYEGTVLTYDPVTNGAEWITVRGITQDLSRAEETSALALYNLVPHSPDAQSERLNRLGENRDMGTAGGKGDCNEDEDEDIMHSQGNSRESTCESDNEGKEDNSQ